MRGRRTALAAVACFAVFVAVAVWEHQVGALPGERWLIAHAFHRTDDANVVQTTYTIANLASPWIAAVTLGLVTWFVWVELGPRAALLAPASCLAGPMAAAVKAVTGPIKLQTDLALLTDTSSSLPSGHTAYVSSLFAVVVGLALRHGRRDVAVTAAIPVAAMGPSLLVKGAHYPGDILAGYALGLGWTLALLAAFPAAGRSPRRRRS